MLKALRSGAVLAVLAFAPTYLAAQEAAPAPAPAAPLGTPASEVDPVQTELQQIQAQLTQIQQQARQDPQIQAANAELMALINQTMAKVEPGFAAAAERATTLRADVAAAQAAQDNAKLHELAAEAKQLQETIGSAREKAMADPAVQEKLEGYKKQLFAKMVEINPEAQKLADRLTELTSKP